MFLSQAIQAETAANNTFSKFVPGKKRDLVGQAMLQDYLLLDRPKEIWRSKRENSTATK